MGKAYSQIGQDRHLVDKIYHGKRDGYFVDVGAYDGVEISNSYLVEQDYGWKGICVEAMPEMFEKLKVARKAICYPYAAYSANDQMLNFSTCDVLSGITDHIDSHLEARSGRQSLIQTKTLTFMLDDAKAPSFIEYLSVDTEGSELEVLKGIDFNKYTFGYINIEHNHVEPRRTEMRNYLETRGYSYYRENQFDDDYIHNSLKGTTS